MFQAIKKIIPSFYNEKSQRKTKSVPFSVRVNKLLNFVLKIVIVFILLFINSLIICYIVNKNFSPYPTVSKEIFFYYDEKNQNNIKTELYVNCSKQKKERGMQCIELGPTKYSFIAHFDISNKIDTTDTKNYEIETVLTTTKQELLVYKKLFFFEQNEPLTQAVNKINYLPLRILGFFEKQKFDINLLDNFANYYDNSIDKIEIIIKSPSINVKFSNLQLKPKNNIITTIFGSLKYLFLFFTFVISFWVEIAFLLLVYLCQKETTKTIN